MSIDEDAGQTKPAVNTPQEGERQVRHKGRAEELRTITTCKVQDTRFQLPLAMSEDCLR